MDTWINNSSNNKIVNFCNRFWICRNYADEENFGNCTIQDIKPYDLHPETCPYFKLDERKINEIDYKLHTIGLTVCYLDKTDYRPFRESTVHGFYDDRTGNFNPNIGGTK